MTTKEKLTEILKLYHFTVLEIEEMRVFLDNDKINIQFYRRLFLRNIFSVIETRLFLNRQFVLIKQIIDGDDITSKERLLLEDKKVISGYNGEKIIVDGYQDFISSFKFSLKIFSKQFHSSTPDFSDANYDALIIFSKRRNEITHPKSLYDLEITYEEILGFNRMFFWVYKVLGESHEGFTRWLEKTWPRL